MTSNSSRPRTRAQVAIRMKQLVIDNQSRVIRRLRARLAERKRETENLATSKAAIEKRSNEIFHLQITRGDNFDLRDSVEIGRHREKKLAEDLECYTKKLAEATQANAKNKEKLEEAWGIIIQLSEVSHRMSKEAEKSKSKRKQLESKHKMCHQEARSLPEEADSEIQGVKNQIAKFTAEYTHLQLLFAEFEDHEEDTD